MLTPAGNSGMGTTLGMCTLDLLQLPAGVVAHSVKDHCAGHNPWSPRSKAACLL